ncbi:AhpC/TSA family protein [Pedobacter metabolipauper]|uniref:AhpC/TSA family protein n=2 Tax=Pedobacter metabolipauper TaxID=425513 RepID=A0A4R6SUB1_9SPHI|nr:AhpC/TSA family protein [Pedobacter metabolipauper]
MPALIFIGTLLSCSSGEATLNLNTKGYGPNATISIYNARKTTAITTKNLVNGKQTISLYQPKKGYARLSINDGTEREFWIYLDQDTYEIETSADDKFEYPVKSSTSAAEQEFIEFYKLKSSMSKTVKENLARATLNMDQATPSTIDAAVKEYDTWVEKRENNNLIIVAAFAKKYPKSNHTILLLEQLGGLDAKARIYSTIFNGLDKEVKDSKDGKAFAEDIEKALSSSAGATLPNLSGKNLQGQLFSKSILKKINVFICWTSYDRLSRENNKDLVPLYEKFKAKGVEFIGIAYDKNEKWWTTVVKDDKLTWPQYSDLLGAKSPNATISDHKAPYVLITDQAGKILKKDVSIGELELELEDELKKL